MKTKTVLKQQLITMNAAGPNNITIKDNQQIQDEQILVKMNKTPENEWNTNRGDFGDVPVCSFLSYCFPFLSFTIHFT